MEINLFLRRPNLFKDAQKKKNVISTNTSEHKSEFMWSGSYYEAITCYLDIFGHLPDESEKNRGTIAARRWLDEMMKQNDLSSEEIELREALKSRLEFREIKDIDEDSQISPFHHDHILKKAREVKKDPSFNFSRPLDGSES